MKEVSIQELHQDTNQWVKWAARKERIITDGGQPIAALTAFEPSPVPKRLPDREDKITKRSIIKMRWKQKRGSFHSHNFLKE